MRSLRWTAGACLRVFRNRVREIRNQFATNGWSMPIFFFAGWLEQPAFSDEDYSLLASREVQAYQTLYLAAARPQLSKASSLCTTCMHMKTTHRTSQLYKATPYPSTLLVARLQERLGYCHVDSELSTAGRRPKSQEACKLVLLSSLRPQAPKKETTSSWFDFGSSGGSLRRM